jgi:hypothetical protein
MSESGLLDRALAGFIASLDPLREAIASPDSLSAFLREFGWSLAPEDIAKVNTALAALASLPADPSSLDTQQLASTVSNLVQGIRGIASSGAPAAFISTFPRELLDAFVYAALARSNQTAFALLHFVGVLGERRVAADATTGRTAYVAYDVHWERLSGLATQPFATVTQAYGWGAQFDAEAFLRSLGILVRGVGGRANLHPTDQAIIDQYYSPDTPSSSSTPSLIIAPPESSTRVTTADRQAKAGVVLMALPIPPSPAVAAPADGVALIPIVSALTNSTIHLSDNVTLTVGGDFVARPVRAELHPDRSIVRATSGDVHIDASARLDAKAPSGAPWILFGDADASRLEMSAAHASIALSGQLDGDADLRVEVGIDDAALVVDFSKSDGFFHDAVASSPTRTALSFSLAWSNKTGFTLSNAPKLQFTIPLRQSLGSLARLQSVEAALGAGPGDSMALDATVSGSVSIGPVNASFTQVGMRLLLDPRTDAEPAGNLGNFDLGFGFKPPSGIGLSLDAHGVLTGGGFLRSDPATGTYGGVLQLSLRDELTLTAYGLIATKLPDGRPGFSLLIFITAQGFKPIPLGFGFELEKIGGMVGIHRTFDQDVLRAGLKNDTLATLLFPRDPVVNAPALLQALSSAFPAKRGSYLLGLVARITWFTPTLVTLDLALILELGARTRLLALGRVSSLLPSKDNDLIRLNLDAMGVLDFDASTLAIDAVLVDSRLVHQFPITGSAAVRAAWSGDGAGFIMSVGGFNPRFGPPASFPSLERVAIALCSGNNPRLVCDAYLAITANTVQFGARASLYAEALGFSVTGDVGFDALVTLLPPHFIVDFHASVQLKRGSHNLFKVTIDGTLEGPLPLRIASKVSFEIFWISFSVHFDYTLVGGGVSQTVPAVAVAAELIKALVDRASWTTRRASQVAQGVSLRNLTAGTTMVLEPLGQLVVQQQVAPLNTARDVDTFGGAPVTGDRRFNLTATLNGQSGQPVPGPFAPARYFTMSDDEKLAAPSFEAMDAGVILGDGLVSFDATTIIPAPLSYETITLNPIGAPVTPPPATPPRYQLPVAAFTRQRPTGAAAKVPARSVGAARFRNLTATPSASLQAVQWRIVRSSDGTVEPVDDTIETWSEYRDELNAMNRGGARYEMIPAHELGV